MRKNCLTLVIQSPAMVWCWGPHRQELHGHSWGCRERRSILGWRWDWLSEPQSQPGRQIICISSKTLSCIFAAQHLVTTRLDSVEEPLQVDIDWRCFRFTSTCEGEAAVSDSALRKLQRKPQLEGVKENPWTQPSSMLSFSPWTWTHREAHLLMGKNATVEAAAGDRTKVPRMGHMRRWHDVYEHISQSQSRC